MKRYDPDKHHRRSIRLKGYDYARPGAYFVTAVAEGRLPVFGDIVDGEMHLSPAGSMVEAWWRELAHKFPGVTPDAFIVMPNHIHGIIIIGAGPAPAAHMGAPLPVGHRANDVGADRCVRPGGMGEHVDTTERVAGPTPGAHTGAPLPRIIQWFKTMTTNAYIRGVETAGWPEFPGRLWQRGYHEHIIRDDAGLDRIRRYVAENPARWLSDPENPGVTPR